MVAIFQKSEELLEEVVLSRTLNCLRGQQDDVRNACTTFIDTVEYVFCLSVQNSMTLWLLTNLVFSWIPSF